MITIDRLDNAASVLNLRAIAREAGINPNTLISRIHRGTPLPTEDAIAIEAVMSRHGITIGLANGATSLAALYLDPSQQHHYVGLGSDGNRYLVPVSPISREAWEQRKPDPRTEDLRDLDEVPSHISRFYGVDIHDQ